MPKYHAAIISKFQYIPFSRILRKIYEDTIVQEICSYGSGTVKTIHLEYDLFFKNIQVSLTYLNDFYPTNMINLL